MFICIITVHSEKRDELEEKFSFLRDNGANELRVRVFDKAKNYTYESDNNIAVIKSIYANTKECIGMGQELALVIQEDVEFVDAERAVSGLRKGEQFMTAYPDADMFMLGTHPNSRHTVHSDGIVKYSHAIHWQAVIFRVSILKKLPETIPTGVHNDAFIAQRMTTDFHAYGLRYPVALQSVTTKLRRKWEYQLLYTGRCLYPYGDPLRQFMYLLFISIVLVVLLFVFM